MAWAESPGTRMTMYVAKRCGNGPCTSDPGCGKTRGTACLSLTQGIHEFLIADRPDAGGGDVLEVEGDAEPYYANHMFFWDQYGAGTADHPKVIRGVRSNAGLLPTVVASSDPNKVKLNEYTGYWSGMTDGGSAPGAAFAFGGSAYWILERLNIDCDNPPNAGAAGFTGISVGQGETPDAGTFGSHHLAFRQLDIRRCTNSAIDIGHSKDILVEGSHFRDNVKTKFNSVFQKDLREDSNGVSIYGESRRILIRGNAAVGNSGDGVQCQGRVTAPEAAAGLPPSSIEEDPRDIIIDSNTFYGNEENAVDIKTCHYVNVIGSNHFLQYLPSDNNGEDPLNTTQCSGEAIILHEGATHILVEGARIEQAGGGISVGNERWRVTDVVIRRNRIHDINQKSKVMYSTGNRVYNCGDGITVHRGDRVDVYHNTLQRIERSGIRVGVSGYSEARDVHIWNNIVSDAKGEAYFLKGTNGERSTRVGGALEYRMDNAPGLYSQANLLFRTGAPVSLLRVTNSGSGNVYQPLSLAQWRAQMTTTVDGQGTLDKAPAGTTAGTEEADPLFPQDSAYTQAGSPARNTALVDSTNAGAGQRCANAPDKGAYESDCTAQVCAGPPSQAVSERDARFSWAKQPGTCMNDHYNAVAFLPGGDLITVGATRGGIGVVNAGGSDAFIQRHAANGGSVVWTRQVGGMGDDSFGGVTTDALGNIYVVGSTASALSGPNLGSHDIFVAKYQQDGTRSWLRQIGTQEEDVGYNARVYGNNLYVVGTTRGDFLSPMVAYGSDQELILQYDLDGQLLRSSQTRNDAGFGYAPLGMAVDSAGNVIAVGCGPENMSGRGPRMIKWAPDLSVLWQQTDDAPEPLCAHAVTTDSDDHLLIASGMDRVNGNLYVVLNGFVVKRNTFTRAVMTTAGGVGIGASPSLRARINDLARGPDGALYVTGRFTTGDASGMEDLFVSRFDKASSGAFAVSWTATASSSAPCSSGDVSHSVAIGPNGEVALAGETCGPVSGTGSHLGGLDPLLLKINSPSP